MNKLKLLKNTSIYSFGEILPKFISFFLLPLYTRFLTPHDYGIISYTSSIVAFLFVVSLMSLNTYLLRDYFEQKNELAQKRLIGNVFSFIIIFNLILTAVAMVIGPFVVDAFHLQIEFKFFRLALINNFFNVCSVIPLIVYRVKERAVSYVLLNISRVFIEVLVVIYLIVSLKWGILGKYYGTMFVYLFYFFIYFLIIYKNSILNLNLKQIKSGLKFSLPLIPGVAGGMLIHISDKVILERYIPLSEMGIYSIAVILGSSIGIITRSAYRAFEPVIFKEFGKDTFETTLNFIKKYYQFVIVVIATAIAVFSREIFYVMASEKFYEGYKYVPFVAVISVIGAFQTIYGAIVIAEKKTMLISKATLGSGIVNLILNIILISWLTKYGMGIYGALIASVIASSISFVILYRGISYSNKMIIREFFSLISMIFIVLFSILILPYQVNILNSFFKLLLLSAYVVFLCYLFGINIFKLAEIKKFLVKKIKT